MSNPQTGTEDFLFPALPGPNNLPPTGPPVAPNYVPDNRVYPNQNPPPYNQNYPNNTYPNNGYPNNNYNNYNPNPGFVVQPTPVVSTGPVPIKAAKKKKSTCCIVVCACIACVIIACIIVAIVLAVVLTRSSSSSSSSTKNTCGFGYQGSYCDECGVTYANSNVKIVGGTEAVSSSWPSMALVVFKYKFYYTYGGSTYLTTYTSYCGGTLITRKHVLTASHCYQTKVSVTPSGGTSLSVTVATNSFHSTIESMYTVYLGVHNKSNIFNGGTLPSTVVSRSVSKFTTHSSYSSSSYLNDIALITLSSEVTLNNNIQLGCLPDSSISSYPTSTGIDVWATGWGTLTSGGSTPDNLYNVKMTLYSSSSCSAVSPSSTKDWTKQICAGNYSGGKDTCQGDSGGPLFIKDTVNKTMKYVQVGITSYGDGCAQAGYPGIYTRVSAYSSWIYTQMNSANKATFDRTNLFFQIMFLFVTVRSIII